MEQAAERAREKEVVLEQKVAVLAEKVGVGKDPGKLQRLLDVAAAEGRAMEAEARAEELEAHFVVLETQSAEMERQRKALHMDALKSKLERKKTQDLLDKKHREADAAAEELRQQLKQKEVDWAPSGM